MELSQSDKDLFLSRLKEVIESNLSNEHFGVAELAREMGMSRSNLHRLVKATTNSTVSQYIRGFRMKMALELLQTSSKRISEVAIESGFGSYTYFSKCFKEYYGVPPSKFSKIEATKSHQSRVRDSESKKKRSIPITSYVWFIIALTIITVIILDLSLGLKLFNPFIKEKSIAVLPVNSRDLDEGNAYLIEGLVNEIRYNLDLVEDLTVASRISVEKYRNTNKTYREIGEELNVNYILACSADTIQDKTLTKFYLLDARTNKDLWSVPLEMDISLENIFDVQKAVTINVSNSMNAILALKEKEKTERNPTENLAAYNSYLLGRNYMNISYYSPNSSSANGAMREAKQLFEQAVELDSTFADAYAELASVYLNNLYWSRISENPDRAQICLDSGLVLLDKALHCDSENLIALKLKVAYLERIGMHQDARRIKNKLPESDENTYLHYRDEVMRFSQVRDDYVEDYFGTIENYIKYLQLKPKEIIVPPYMLSTMMYVFREAGFPEYDEQIVKQLFDFNNDSVVFLRHMVSSEIYQGNFKAALDYALSAQKLDPANVNNNWLLALCYLWLEDYTDAYTFLVISEDLRKQKGLNVRPRFISGYIYHMNGYEKEANYHFEGELARRLKQIEYSKPNSRQEYNSKIYFAGYYLARGDEETALKYLKALERFRQIDYGTINILINDPGFKSIRKNPEFQDLLQHLETTYQKQHKHIEPLIEELKTISP